MKPLMQFILPKRSAGFTLIELLLASFIVSVLIAAIYGIFSTAIQLREKGQELVDRNAPATAAIEIIRRDISNMVIPSGTYAGAILGQSSSQGQDANDTLSFFTSSAIIIDQNPWADIQQVNYRLAPPESEDVSGGQDLLREVTRNLAPTGDNPAQEQHLLKNVQSLRFEYLGAEDSAWVDSWDSASNDNASPRAVKVSIDFASQDDEPPIRPIQICCEIAARGADSATTASQTGGEGQ